jgi:Type VI secretion system effector, Hcp
MATLAFLSFFDEAQGESVQKGKEKWIELRGWSWGVDADTSWTRGSGASVLQQVEMVFKSVRAECRPQDRRTGKLGTAKVYSWDVTTGAVAP